MKSRLVAILMILLFSGIFSACTEEEVNPINSQEQVKAFGTARTDNDDGKGF